MTSLSPSHDDHAGLGRTDGPPTKPAGTAGGWEAGPDADAPNAHAPNADTPDAARRGLVLGAERTPVLHLPDIHLPEPRRDGHAAPPLRRALAGMRRVAAQAVRQRMSTELSDLAGRIRKLHETDSR